MPPERPLQVQEATGRRITVEYGDGRCFEWVERDDGWRCVYGPGDPYGRSGQDYADITFTTAQMLDWLKEWAG